MYRITACSVKRKPAGGRTRRGWGGSARTGPRQKNRFRLRPRWADRILFRWESSNRGSEREGVTLAGGIRKKSVLFSAFFLLLVLDRPAGSRMLLVSLGDGGAHVDLVVREITVTPIPAPAWRR